MGNKFQWNLNQDLYIFIQENAFDCVVCEMTAILSRPECVKCLCLIDHIALLWNILQNVYIYFIHTLDSKSITYQTYSWMRWL